MSGNLLEVRDLETIFRTDEGTVRAVDRVSFSLGEGKTMALVGESGCGKSVSALSIMGLIPNPPGKVIGGSILLEGEDLLKKSEKQMLKIRGNKIAMIFQEPMSSLNPVVRVGSQIVEAITTHNKVSRQDAAVRAVESLRLVGIPDPENRFLNFPHQLSGGMRQRVMIAMALACNAKILIADEPTTALDVTIQAQILDLMKKLQREQSVSILMITHDMGVVADMAHHVAIMYAGRVVEYGRVVPIFKNPGHPYTKGLLDSIPVIHEDRETLPTINGLVPNLLNMPKGCRFSPRCAYAENICHEKDPELAAVDEDGHAVACWKYGRINFNER